VKSTQDLGTNEYSEMIRLIQSEFDAEIDYSIKPNEVQEARQPVDQWRARNVFKAVD
jgi:glutathionyl-hydroquinone reductase